VIDFYGRSFRKNDLVFGVVHYHCLH